MQLHMGRKVTALIVVTTALLIVCTAGRAALNRSNDSAPCPAGFVIDRVEGCQEQGIWRATTVNGSEYDRNAHAVYMAFLPYGNAVAREMVRCMNRESHGNRFAANTHDSHGGSYGLLQLNGVHRWRSESLAQFKARMFNVKSHLEAAVRLYNGARHAYGNGFQPWGGWC